MSNIENIQLTGFGQSISVDTSTLVTTSFLPRLPRGVVATIRRSEVQFCFAHSASAQADGFAFGGVTKFHPDDIAVASPITAQDIQRLSTINPVMVCQSEEGTAVDLLVQRNISHSTRDFRNDPHETAEIRNTGRRSNNLNGWEFWVGAITATAVINFLASLEVTLRYLEGHGSRKNLNRQQKLLGVLNQ